MPGSVIGIDLSGTQVAVAALGDGALGESRVARTDCSDTGALIDQLTVLVERTEANDLQGVGVGVDRIVEFETGRIIPSWRPSSRATNRSLDLPLENVSLRAELADRLGVPVFVDNHSNVAALGEAHDDQGGLVTRHLVMISVGHGVGGGLVLGGRIYRGATGGAAELGHTMIGLDLAGAVPAPMRFPQPGSLEFVASGNALDGLAAQARNVHPASELGRLRAEGKPVLGDDVIRAALEGDESAARMVEIWGQRIGIGVANAINTFDPEEVVIGGDAARAGEILLTPAIRVARHYAVPGVGGGVRIRLSRHGERAGVLGAALLALYEG
ncbi:MAG TPA: ROK family protein [Thermoleophilaceae bacterium]|jgi:glucokinase|nr:ROK family protein [Thermoleophilaceae bacterium]